MSENLALAKYGIIYHTAMPVLRLFWYVSNKSAQQSHISVPAPSAYSRFLKRLLQNPEDVDAIFHKLVDKLKQVLPDLWRILAIGRKSYKNMARPKNNRGKQCKPDRRRDMDVGFGKNGYKQCLEPAHVYSFFLQISQTSYH